MRVVVDGVEVYRLKWKWPDERIEPEKRIIAGSVSMFRHGKVTSQYKDIYIEANPTEDKLITLDSSKE